MTDSLHNVGEWLEDEIVMDIKAVMNNVKNKGVINTYRIYKDRKANRESIWKNGEKIYKILLLTNRDSDNVGDQVIEACDIALISTVMKNLNIGNANYKINSRAAGIISQKYLATRNPELLKTAEGLIKNSDIIIFGGAPLFNYRYQVFYERTAITLELAQKYHKPVIFSAIGVEGYDEHNEKCQRLKKTLNFECVRQITTRDDFESLEKFIDNESIDIEKVSDPAVFASVVFANYVARKNRWANKKIGIFILRANGFKDNKFDFSRDDAAELWKNIIKELENKEYDYEVLTSGHFGDEAFLDFLIKKHDIRAEKCVFNMNTPEKLIEKISSYDAVISCRLHPSIISFSLDVPSLGIVWNSKVKYFYDSIGYGERIIDINSINVSDIVERVEKSISQGINKNEEYQVSVYRSLFYGIQKILCPSEKDIMPYTYNEIKRNISLYKGTTENEQEKKIERKFRRTYGKYNELFDKVHNKK